MNTIFRITSRAIVSRYRSTHIEQLATELFVDLFGRQPFNENNQPMRISRGQYPPIQRAFHDTFFDMQSLVNACIKNPAATSPRQAQIMRALGADLVLCMAELLNERRSPKDMHKEVLLSHFYELLSNREGYPRLHRENLSANRIVLQPFKVIHV